MKRRDGVKNLSGYSFIIIISNNDAIALAEQLPNCPCENTDGLQLSNKYLMSISDTELFASVTVVTFADVFVNTLTSDK